MTTNLDSVLKYIQHNGKNGLTITQIHKGTSISPRQHVYQITKKLRGRGLIQGHQLGKEWFFYPMSETPSSFSSNELYLSEPSPSGGKLSPEEFEELARDVFSRRYNTNLIPGKIPGVPKKFDMVSSNRQTVGDAKYVTYGNQPSGKFATIAEYVWLLEKTNANTLFLVFGNEQLLPDTWLIKFGHLCENIDFYFMRDDGDVEKLS